MAEIDWVTTMMLKVMDLQCSKCYKKVKKVLCKFPQIQDQVYDEKNNTVTIKVVCCSPEKMRDKICCKGRGSIICIKILPPPPPPSLVTPSSSSPELSSTLPSSPPSSISPVLSSTPPSSPTPPSSISLSPPSSLWSPSPSPSLQPPPLVCLGLESVRDCCTDCHLPVRDCCTDCRDGRRGGPCYNPCYGGGYRGYSRSRCSEYYSEENSQGCTIM